MAKNPEIRQFMPSTEAFKGHEKIYTLDHLPRVRDLLTALGSDTIGGEPFRANLREMGGLLGKAYTAIQTESTPSGAPIRPVYPSPLVVGIPRGGLPLAEGIRSELPHSTYLLTNAGDEKIPDESLFPDNFPTGSPPSPILLVDTAIGSGATIMQHLDALKEKAPDSRIIVLSAIALLDHQGHGLSRVFESYPDISVITGRLEKKAEWRERKDGKHLYVHGIGSIGDLVSVP